MRPYRSACHSLIHNIPHQANDLQELLSHCLFLSVVFVPRLQVRVLSLEPEDCLKVLAVQQVNAIPDSLLLLHSPTLGADPAEDTAGAGTLFLHIGDTSQQTSAYPPGLTVILCSEFCDRYLARKQRVVLATLLFF